jgi:hypothetical protein
MASVLHDAVLVSLIDRPLDAAQHRVLDGAAEIAQEAADPDQVLVLGFERLQQFSFSVSRRFLDGVMERRLG